MMTLTTDQVIALAPDAASVAAAKQLARLRDWRNLGRSEVALWGECQGSALYQVRVDLTGGVAKCSCPSRKIPCKHALALMLMAAGTPDRLPLGSAPAWVDEWLAQRTETADRRTAREARKQTRGAQPVDAAAQAKRAGQRADRVRAGLDALELWMHDLVRHGLATIETQGAAPWYAQAARLVDAQAPALASRLRGLAGIPRSRPRWADDLVAELGRIALLIHAYRRLDDLDPPLRADVRQLIGWTVKEDEVIAAGDLVEDDWLVIGQWTDISGDERIRVQRTWLLGARTRRTAMVLQFAAGNAAFPEQLVPATRVPAILAFWPSALPQRALVRERRGPVAPLQGRLPGSANIQAFLASVADALSRLPWMSRMPGVLLDVVPVRARDGAWSLVDRDAAALPVAGSDRAAHWSLLACSGGHPIDVACEWNGRALTPMLAMSTSDTVVLTQGGEEM
jgi:hypothetical protein